MTEEHVENLDSVPSLLPHREISLKLFTSFSKRSQVDYLSHLIFERKLKIAQRSSEGICESD